MQREVRKSRMQSSLALAFVVVCCSRRISGNLVADPTSRETNSGTPVASATIANNEFFNDGDGERQQVTTFADVTVRGKSGESFASLAKKGQEVIIEDQLRRNDWESEGRCRVLLRCLKTLQYRSRAHPVPGNSR